MLSIEINLQPNLEEKIKYLLQRNANKNLFFSDLISFKITELTKANKNIEIDLRKYEKKYNISSESFYNMFESGKYDDSDDYLIWSGIYELLLENKEELSKLL